MIDVKQIVNILIMVIDLVANKPIHLLNIIFITTFGYIEISNFYYYLQYHSELAIRGLHTWLFLIYYKILCVLETINSLIENRTNIKSLKYETFKVQKIRIPPDFPEPLHIPSKDRRPSFEAAAITPTDDPDMKYGCALCEQLFRTQDELSNHVSEAH